MDNPNLIIKKTDTCGEGVFATKHINPGEVIASFDGQIYDYDFPNWTQELADHVIQFERRKWRDSNGIARMINHSCEPNCGIKNKFDIVAMRQIKIGEEIKWDYEMTEDNDHWCMNCKCGASNCRKIVGAYRNMPQEIREKYRGYISDWLVQVQEQAS